jgi:TonB-dependent receptor
MNSSRFQSRKSQALGFAAKSVLAILLSCSSLMSFSQEAPLGTLSGTIQDADYGGSVLNAKVTILKNQTSVKANGDGRYIIDSLPEGIYTLVVTASFYKTSRIESVVIGAGESKKLDIPLFNDNSEVFELEAFSVKAAVLEESDIGLISQRQKAPAISDAMGAESFSRLGLGNVAEALSKVTGTSIQDGKYVIVRGLSDRYNTTTLNGSTIPSADPNRKSVQLDQFPTDLLDVIETTKTFTPDKSGDFTGGAIDIRTKSFPDQFFYNVSYGIGYNANTTGDSFLSYPGGGDDWLGKDDGTRSIPERLLQNENLSSLSNEEQSEILNEFSPVVSPVDSGDAPLNQRFSFAFGDSILLSGDGEKRLGYAASLTHSRDFRTRIGAPEVRYQFDRGVEGNVMVPEYDMSVDESENSVNLGGLFNVALQLSSDDEIGLKNFYNQSGNDRSFFQQGIVEGSESKYLRESRIHFTERNIRSSQLYGKHVLNALGGGKIEWDYSKSKSSQNEPDYIIFFDAVDLESFRDVDEDLSRVEPEDWKFPTGFTNRRMYRSLEENADEFGFDFDLPISFGDRGGSSFKTGFRRIEADREYGQFSFSWGNGDRYIPYTGNRDDYLAGDATRLDENGETGVVMRNLTDAYPEYFGSKKIDAAYIMADIPFVNKFRFVGGLRHEDTAIEVVSKSGRPQFIPDAESGISEDHLLPAANLIYSIDERQNLRFAVTKTIARPSFRELTSAAEFDAIGSFQIIGNPELKMSEVTNFDFRWEMFPENGDELFAVSVFFKELENPIEQVIDRFGFISWDNVETGEVRGLELEARKKLGFLSSQFTAFSVGGNLSVIDSEVNRSQLEIDRKIAEFPDLSPTRELQGQSSLIYNFDTSWEHFQKGTGITLSYNNTGERLYAVTNSSLPLVDEQPAEDLDLIVSQRLGSSWKLKFKVGNLLDSESTRFHTYQGVIFPYSAKESGRTFSMGVSYGK